MALLFRTLTGIAALVAVTTMVYGMVRFPDAPIRAVAGGYIAKGGKARTAADYRAFLLWQKAMFIAFPAVFALGFLSEIVRNRARP